MFLGLVDADGTVVGLGGNEAGTRVPGDTLDIKRVVCKSLLGLAGLDVPDGGSVISASTDDVLCVRRPAEVIDILLVSMNGN